MDFLLSDPQTVAQEVAREFAARELSPRYGEIDRKRELPEDLPAKMAESSLLGLIIPEVYGGAGLDAACLVTAVEEVSRGCPSVGVVLAAHSFLCRQVLTFGSEGLKQELLPLLAAGAIGSVAISEPNAAAGLMAISTAGTPVPDGFSLTGNKVYTSNSAIARFTSVLFRTSTQEGPPSFTFGIVDNQDPGVVKGRLEHLTGLGGDGIHPLTFQKAQVPSGRILGQTGGGLKVLQGTSGLAYLCIAAAAVGAARELLQQTMVYAKQRDSGLGPLATQQVVQQYVAEMSVLVESSHLMVQKAAWEYSRGAKGPLPVWQARVFSLDAAKRVGALAQLIFGAYGYSEEYPVSRFVRDITGLQFIFSNQDIIRGNTGRLLLDLPPA